MPQRCNYPKDTVQTQPQHPLPQTHPGLRQDLLPITSASIKTHVGLPQSTTTLISGILWPGHQLCHRSHFHEEMDHTTISTSLGRSPRTSSRRPALQSCSLSRYTSHRESRCDSLNSLDEIKDPHVEELHHSLKHTSQDFTLHFWGKCAGRLPICRFKFLIGLVHIP